MNNLFQTADWKVEKHMPIIVLSRKNGSFQAAVSVGKELPHPNTSAHHISWIELYFHPAETKFPILIGRNDFSAHGASVDGPDTSGVYSSPEAVFTFNTEKSGTVHAASYCNIHGLWTNTVELIV